MIFYCRTMDFWWTTLSFFVCIEWIHERSTHIKKHGWNGQTNPIQRANQHWKDMEFDGEKGCGTHKDKKNFNHQMLGIADVNPFFQFWSTQVWSIIPIRWSARRKQCALLYILPSSKTGLKQASQTTNNNGSASSKFLLLAYWLSFGLRIKKCCRQYQFKISAAVQHTIDSLTHESRRIPWLFLRCPI